MCLAAGSLKLYRSEVSGVKGDVDMAIRKKKYKKLRAVLAALDMTLSDLGEVIGRSESYIARRMSGELEWGVDEAYLILDKLELPADELAVYFPAAGVDVNDVPHHKLSEKEKMLLTAYEDNPDMQAAVNRLLGIAPGCNRTIRIAR